MGNPGAIVPETIHILISAARDEFLERLDGLVKSLGSLSERLAAKGGPPMCEQDALKGRDQPHDSPVIQLRFGLCQQTLAFVQRLVQEDGSVKSETFAGFAK